MTVRILIYYRASDRIPAVRRHIINRNYGLPIQLQSELNLPRRSRGRSNETCSPSWMAACVENVRIFGGSRLGKVRVVQDIKELRPELRVEVLRNPLDRVVLKQGEIQVRRPRPSQDVATGIASKIETLERIGIYRASQTGWCWVAVGRPKRGIGRSGDRKTLGLDVFEGIPRIGERCATRTGQSIRERPGVATIEALRVAIRAPGCGKGNAITHLIDPA